uniref:Uncharacterized protein n=1 Tax=Dioszegia changbaiensis TaxID=234950 RepID=A0A7G7XQE4_9TREE|nr:hypothetical protein [Dioszegia changbaiensis]
MFWLVAIRVLTNPTITKLLLKDYALYPSLLFIHSWSLTQVFMVLLRSSAYSKSAALKAWPIGCLSLLTTTFDVYYLLAIAISFFELPLPPYSYICSHKCLSLEIYAGLTKFIIMYKWLSLGLQNTLCCRLNQ